MLFEGSFELIGDVALALEAAREHSGDGVEEAEGVAVREARLPGFDDDLQWRLVINPVSLSFIEVFIQVGKCPAGS